MTATKRLIRIIEEMLQPAETGETAAQDVNQAARLDHADGAAAEFLG